MQNNLSLLMPVEGRERNHVFNKNFHFIWVKGIQSDFVEITLALHDIPKGQDEISLVPGVSAVYEYLG